MHIQLACSLSGLASIYVHVYTRINLNQPDHDGEGGSRDKIG